MPVEIARKPELEPIARTMPFDQFGRYHMLREAVDACRQALQQERLTLLDAGGFYDDHGTATLPIKQFLPDDDITVLDVVDCDLPAYVKGDGTRLTFADDSFDLVVSSDTLEHIPPASRASFWGELVRTARSGVILLAPFRTPGVLQAEELIFAYIEHDLHAEHDQLKEHRDYGLPVLEEWTAYLEQQGMHLRTYPTGQLDAWTGMMLLKHLILRTGAGIEAEQMLDWFYNRCIFPTERRNPAYRHLVLAARSANLVAAVDQVIAPTIWPDTTDTTAAWAQAFLPTMLAIVQRQLCAVQDDHREQFATHHRHTSEQFEQYHAATSRQIGDNHHSTTEQFAAYHGATNDHLRHVHEAMHDHLGGVAQQLLGSVDHAFRQQVSMLDRIIADQQMTIQQLNQAVHTQAIATTRTQAALEQREQELRALQQAVADLSARATWLDEQNRALRQQLEAVQQGKVMRILNTLSGGR
ncbi:MAG: methyltransferase domain-containing protein [Chloroflexaceae bacterium]|nr:methyltransferase domain-containing protein [Chloroflexaceae bacterium]